MIMHLFRLLAGTLVVAALAGPALAEPPCLTGGALVDALEAKDQDFVQTGTQQQRIGQAPSALGSEARALAILALADPTTDLNQVTLNLNGAVPPCMPEDCPAEVGFTREDRAEVRAASQAIVDAYLARQPRPDAPQSLRALATPARVAWAHRRLGCGEQTPVPAPTPTPMPAPSQQSAADYEAMIAEIAAAYQEGDFEMAMAIAAPMCELESAQACFYSGIMYAFGEGVAADAAKAIAEEEIACNGGVVFGCNLLGALYYESEPPLRDHTKARDAYRRACDGEEAASCVEYARMMANGEGGPQDAMNALATANAACQAGEGMGCTLSAMIMARQPVADYDMIMEKAKLGCDYGDDDGCALMGAALLEDALGAGDMDALTEALGTLETYCNSGSRASCSTLAFVYTDEEIGMGDALNGAVFAAKACALGSTEWCE